jgi:DNA-binding transcriptional LysR family regulator
MTVNLRDIDLNLLTIFEAIMAERKMTTAAARLGMTQPALSNALARLRLRLDDPLFVRTARGMDPTPRATAMAGPVRQALDLVRTGLEPPGEFDFASTDRTFTVGMSDYVEVALMSHFVDWIARTAPGINLEIRTGFPGRLSTELREGTLDLVADYSQLSGRGFRRDHLLNEGFASLVRRDHPAVRQRLDLDTFLQLRHVAVTPPPGLIPPLESWLRERGLERRIALRVPHLLSMPVIVSQTDFICTVPERMARKYAGPFDLRMLSPPVELEAVEVFQTWHARSENDPGQRWMRRALSDLCTRL